MLISYQWLKEFIPTLPPAEHVAKLLTEAGLEVESIAHHGTELAKVRVAQVVSQRPHPGSKNPLTLVTVALGAAPHERVEVVCGAPNVPAPGGLVCFAPLGTRVLDRKGQSFVLEAKEIAGITSVGMLCAEDELGLGSSHDGLLILSEGTVGKSLLETLPALQDWIFEVNVTPNRPDALGHLGVARDAAVLLRAPFQLPPIPTPTERFSPSTPSPDVSVELLAPDACPRYSAALVTELQDKPSPLWLRVRLQRLGVRPIRAAVDITNLVMLELGHPMHAFDLDKLDGQALRIRYALTGESLQTLDGVTRTLHEEDLVIADTTKPVALAGVMGCEASGIGPATRRAVLEAAFFEPRGIRRTARRHGMHSEASHRFEREVDRSHTLLCLERASRWLEALGVGRAVGSPQELYPRPAPQRIVKLRFDRAKAVLGVALPTDESIDFLQRAGFHPTAQSPEGVELKVPWHRPDVQREIDLIEEIARFHGYSKIVSQAGGLHPSPAGATRDYRLRRRTREHCAGLGLNEAISMSFISAKELELTGFAAAPRVRLANPLSEERALLRPSLLPRLLHATAHAFRHNVQKVRLFEVGTVFAPEGGHEPGLPLEKTMLAMVLAGHRDTWLSKAQGVDFYDGKGLLEAVVDRLVLGLPELLHVGEAPAWAHPRAWAAIHVGGKLVGHVAELHPNVRENMELPKATVLLELALEGLAKPLRTLEAAVPGKFPSMRRDLALVLPKDKPAGQVLQALRTSAGEFCDRVELFDRYAGPELPDGTHSLAFALNYRSNARTLTDDEVDTWTKRAVEHVSQHYGARQR